MGRHIRARRQVAIEEPAVNLTPLIDVVFVILIMFIVVAPLLEMDRIELAAAQAHSNTQSIQESSPIAIQVRRDNSILFNHQPVSMEQLPGLLQKAKKQYPKARPQLFHDKKGHFGVYQAIKNAAEAAGFEQLDIVLNPG